jgi:ubiquinone/menaquinone biosynthesis C-methylase UbiE
MTEDKNYSQYQDKEFMNWAYRDKLIPAERFLIQKFLSKEQSTIEAGTGGGCILHNLRDMGFKNLHGFDFLPAFIEVAKSRDTTNTIRFTVADAAALPYKDASFRQAIYLQQVICMIADAGKREQAVSEAARILAPGGTALFSFLCYEARARQAVYSMFLTYLKTFRLFFHRGTSIQLQPWLKHERSFNPGALLDKPPYVYWYKVKEAVDLLSRNELEVTEAASAKEITKETTVEPHRLYNGDVTGMLYLVARKK